jgi:hypothetical protein
LRLCLSESSFHDSNARSTDKIGCPRSVRWKKSLSKKKSKNKNVRTKTSNVTFSAWNLHLLVKQETWWAHQLPFLPRDNFHFFFFSDSLSYLLFFYVEEIPPKFLNHFILYFFCFLLSFLQSKSVAKITQEWKTLTLPFPEIFLQNSFF